MSMASPVVLLLLRRVILAFKKSFLDTLHSSSTVLSCTQHAHVQPAARLNSSHVIDSRCEQCQSIHQAEENRQTVQKRKQAESSIWCLPQTQQEVNIRQVTCKRSVSIPSSLKLTTALQNSSHLEQALLAECHVMGHPSPDPCELLRGSNA